MDASALFNRLPAWRNRGLTHIFLGHPESPACAKTTVEPGGAFSPGVWTCGITVWIDAGAGWVCAEDLPPEQVQWTFIAQPGDTPLAVSRWGTGGIEVEHRLGHLGLAGGTGLDAVELLVRADQRGEITVAVAVTDQGPAGGPLATLAWDAGERRFTTDEGITITLESPAMGFVLPAGEGRSAPLGVAMVTLAAASDSPGRLAFLVRHAFARRAFARHWQPPAATPAPVAEVQARIAADWRATLPARLHAPDPRVALAWERSAYHLLAAMEHGRPRIGAVNYPVFWIRDGVIILRALDVLGRHDLARIGCDELAPMIFGGGFGAEADAPGEGIWALVRHALTTADRDWLSRVFPDIAKRVEWIRRMRSATTPLIALSENRIPAYQPAPGCALVCLPAQDGLVHGRMDFHTPDFFINCWCQAGLRLAAEAARWLGRDSEAAAWAQEARDLDQRIAERLLPAYGNERDPACAPHPTGAIAGHGQALAPRFAAWLRSKRLDQDGRRIAEPLWTYFEAAQAHNALRFGLREEAWTILDGMLAPDGPHDAGAFIEGRASAGERLPFCNDIGSRGWLHPRDALGGNMPHNWTTAEIILALRDVFVRDDDGDLVIGAGVPARWLVPGASFGVEGLSTRRGPVSWRATVRPDRSLDLVYDGPRPFTTAFPE